MRARSFGVGQVVAVRVNRRDLEDGMTPILPTERVVRGWYRLVFWLPLVIVADVRVAAGVILVSVLIVVSGTGWGGSGRRCV